MEKKGKPSPLSALPHLDDHTQPYWDAYTTLHNHRNGSSPIAFSEIVTYLNYHEVRPTERPFWIKAIESLDAIWLKHVADEQEKALKETKKHGNHRARRS